MSVDLKALNANLDSMVIKAVQRFFLISDTGQTKPKPRGVKDEAESSSDQKMCLIRATLNKKKISTVVSYAQSPSREQLL